MKRRKGKRGNGSRQCTSTLEAPNGLEIRRGGGWKKEAEETEDEAPRREEASCRHNRALCKFLSQASWVAGQTNEDAGSLPKRGDNFL